MRQRPAGPHGGCNERCLCQFLFGHSVRPSMPAILDAVLEKPLFAGADTSYWIRQSIPLIGGGGTFLSMRNGVLASLRSSREHGQSNFTNPGLHLLGVGADFDVTPGLRFISNPPR